MRCVPTLLLLAFVALGCTPNGTLRLYGYDDDDSGGGPAADDDDVAPDDDDVAPDDDDVADDDDDVAPDDDDVADDDDATPPEVCDNGPSGSTAEASALAAAMGVGGIELISVVGSAAPTMMAVRSGLGLICPIVGPEMALLSTGDVTNIELLQDYDYPGNGEDASAGDLAELTLLLNVPPEAQSMRFHFLFLSREYPEWVGSAYNDGFQVEVNGSAYSGPAGLDSVGDWITVNSPEILSQTGGPGFLAGSGFDEDGSTGWLRAAVPVAGGETVTVRFWIYDVADGVWDSAVLLDGIQFMADSVAEPTLEQVWP